MVLAPEIYNKLLSFLDEGEDLRSYFGHAVIAGGAISNLIYNQETGNQGPINDIDVFIFKQNDQVKETNLDGAVDNYATDITANNLKLSTTERKGILNIITVLVDRIAPLSDMGYSLIEGFDINCTKSFLTLEENPKLIMHNEFSSFLKTKQLISYRTKTPVKTMMRIVKKKKELNAYLSDYHLKSIYQLAKGKTTSIIEENFEKFKEEMIVLSPFFKFFKMSNGLYKAKYLAPFLELHRNEKSVMRDSSLRERMIPIFDLHFSGNKLYNKYLKLRSYKKALKIFVSTEDLINKLKDDFNKDDLVYLEKILRKVIGTGTFFKKGSVNEAIQKAKIINRFSDEGEIYLGFLGLLRFESQDINILEEYAKFKDSYLASDAHLVIPYKLSPEISENVVELTTKTGLMEESRKMSHCVSGYAVSVEKNQCRIFSIRAEKRSTLEVVYHHGKFVGIQHRAFGNTFPAEENRQIAFKLIKYLNENIKLEEDFAPKDFSHMMIPF